MDYMAENNIAWILYKWDINIKRYPLYARPLKSSPSLFLQKVLCY
jgi:medium-chain acyl-[acyl-carrier-protein] hydrolase